MKVFKKLLMFFTALLTVTSIFGFRQDVKANVNGTPKELTQAITNVLIWDTGNGREANKTGNTYALTKDVNYSLETHFDLSAYNNNLSNGDHFTFNIPAPYTIRTETLPLIDPDTGIEIGDVVVTSLGDNAGGHAKVTLKNLDQYLIAKGATNVTDVKGRFYTVFSVKTLQDETPTSFPDVAGGKTFNITVKERQATDNSGTVGIENLAKYGGVLTDQAWNSAILNQSGNHWHKWRVRANASGKTYDQLTLHDSISQAHAPMQYIPEYLTVTAGDGINQGWQLTNPKTLVAGQDYTVTYNADYTNFTLVIHNPGNRRFMVDYSTTAPADGSRVANTASITTNGQPIKTADNRNSTETTVERLSKIQTGGAISISPDGRITIYKLDQATRQPLAGAVFKVTKPDGTSITLQPTEATLGRTQSDVFSDADIAAGTFKIEEITAPAGYELDPTVHEVTVTKDGVFRQIFNKKATTGSVVVNYIRESDGKVIKTQAVDTNNAAHDTDYNTDVDLKDNEIIFAEDGKTYEFTRQATDLTDPAIVANGNITRVDPATGKVEAGITKVVTYIYKEKPQTGSVVVNYIRESDGQVIKPQANDTTDAAHDTDYNTDVDLKERTIIFDGKTYDFVRVATDVTDPAIVANGNITRVDPATGKVEAGVTKVVTYIYKLRVSTAIPTQPTQPTRPSTSLSPGTSASTSNSQVNSNTSVGATVTNPANNNGNNNGATNAQSGKTGTQVKKTLPATGEEKNVLTVLGMIIVSLAILIFTKKSKEEA